MSAYTLYHGDCLDILPTLEAGSIDAIICDPPYGTTACKWDSVIPFEPMWAGIKRVVKRHSAIVLFGSQPFTSALVMSNPKWFRYEWVWLKNRKTGYLNARIMPMMSTESVCVFGDANGRYYPQMRSYGGNTHGMRGGVNRPKQTYGNVRLGQFYPKVVDPKNGVAYPDNTLRFDCDVDRLHPTQKPLALMEYLVKTYTNEGDAVLDFTMGSGTTGHACMNTGRRFIGIEKDTGYFRIAQERIADAYEPLRAMEAV